LKPYQKERIVGLFDPTYDPLGVNYSTIQSKIAVGSGGWFGKGFGQGTQVQLGFLPAAPTDYIFSSFIEEWGFVGGFFIIALFGLAIFSIMRIGLHADNNFYRFICLGAAIMFLVQFGINVGSALGLLPVIGITFPFFSYGGSSLLINAMMIGIVQSAAVYRSLG
jgi:rod shape determining protein RodA